jgi:CDP-diacylglycerol--glycerol-3-phosphate 3-phosphatidyltransferase
VTPARPLAADPAAQPAQTARVVNIANGLTLLRLLLVPVFVVLLLANGGHSSGWRIWATIAFAAATITDLVDGDLARSRGLVTEVGKIADPIADKALTGAALIGLSALGDLPWWVTVLILAREIGVTGLRFFVIRHGVIPASRGGKLKTFLQNIAIGLYVLPLSDWAGSMRFWLMAAAVAITVVTGVDYVARAVRLRRTSARAALKRERRAAADRAKAAR